MRLLVIADVHANLVALETVLRHASSFDAVLNAGDIVGYNPWPRECIEKVRKVKAVSVLGNHDRDSALGTPVGYNPYAEMACLWTHRALSEKERRFLLGLPNRVELEFEGVRLYICHGSPDDPVDEYVFPPPFTPRSRLQSFLARTKAGLVILGHTHVPFCEEFESGVVLNPGAVGQPRDHDPRASYALVELERGCVDVELRRVDYDVERTARQVLAAGLPSVLAQRLFFGY